MLKDSLTLSHNDPFLLALITFGSGGTQNGSWALALYRVTNMEVGTRRLRPLRFRLMAARKVRRKQNDFPWSGPSGGKGVP